MNVDLCKTQFLTHIFGVSSSTGVCSVFYTDISFFCKSKRFSTLETVMRIVARKTFQSEIKLFIGRCKAKPLCFAWSCMACESHPCKLHEHRRVIHKCLLVEYNRDLVQRTRRPKIRYIRTILVYSTKHVVVVMFSANICASLERTNDLL